MKCFLLAKSKYSLSIVAKPEQFKKYLENRLSAFLIKTEVLEQKLAHMVADLFSGRIFMFFL